MRTLYLDTATRTPENGRADFLTLKIHLPWFKPMFRKRRLNAPTGGKPSVPIAMSSGTIKKNSKRFAALPYPNRNSNR